MANKPEYQLVLETPEGAYYVMPPTEDKENLEAAADHLSEAYYQKTMPGATGTWRFYTREVVLEPGR